MAQAELFPGLINNNDFGVAIAAGSYPWYSVLNIAGTCPSLSTAVTSITAESTVYPFLASATALTSVASDSTNDRSGGTGASDVIVFYLDEAYQQQSTSITLQGSSAQSITSSVLRVNGMIVSSAGSTKTNAGKLYVGTGAINTGKPATVLATVAIGIGESRDGVYTVPANNTFITTSGQNIQVGVSSAVSYSFEVFTTSAISPASGGPGTGPRISQFSGKGTGADAGYTAGFMAIPARTDIDIRGQTLGALLGTAAAITVTLNGFLLATVGKGGR